MNISQQIENIEKIHTIVDNKEEEYYFFWLDTLLPHTGTYENGGIISFNSFLEIIKQIDDEIKNILDRERMLIQGFKGGKVSKIYPNILIPYYDNIKNLSESIKEEYKGTLHLWKEIFPKIDYYELNEKLDEYRRFLSGISEVGMEASRLIKNRVHDDAEFYYFDIPKSTLVRLNDIISYDSKSFEFILNSNKSEKYPLHGYPNKIKFMEILINAKEDIFVPYSEFITSIGLTYNGTGHGKDEEGQLMQLKSGLIRDIERKFRGMEIDFISTKKGYKLKR